MFIDILFFIVSYDIWFYFSHLILHNKYVYKIIHREHHKTDYKTIVFTDTYVGHFIESPFQGIGVLFPFLFFTPLDMYSLLYSLMIINIRGMLRHDHRFIWLIGNHHILHHKNPQYNFGEYWIDKLFGTNNPNTNEYKFGMIYI
jgi:sterol desaturase/sphingolipid hydroxylase (fatty acid hydroxylase superfamily)